MALFIKLTIEHVHARGLERGFILLSDTYAGSKIKLKWQCKNGHITEKSFNDIDQGKGCLDCSGLRKLTIEEVRVRGAEKGFVLISDIYSNSLTKLLWQCSVGHFSYKKFNDIDQGSGCIFCSGLDKISFSDVKERALLKGFEFVSGEYKNSKSKLQWRCRRGHITVKHYNQIDQGRGCLDCSGLKKLTASQINNRATALGFKWVSGYYTSNKSKMKWSCKNGHEFENKFNKIDQGRGCPVCAQKHDKAQKELYQYVLGMYPDTEYDRTKILKNPRLELDVYIPSLRKAIELDGEYWHSLPGAPERDARKDEECQEAGIQLLRLRYTEHWYNKQETVGKPKVLEFLVG